MTYRIWDKKGPINGCPAETALKELNYSVNDEIYIIMNEQGRDWIIQSQNDCPYPGESIEDSAQNHINKMIEEQEQEKQKKSSTQERLDEQDELIAALVYGEV